VYGASLPTFVEQEFRDFLTCGVLAQASRVSDAPTVQPTNHSTEISA
jgi:hypothetical protein